MRWESPPETSTIFFHACTSATMSPPTLESRGRTDVIRALSAHCIEYQSNFHSIQSAAAVYLRRLGSQDWALRCPTQILAKSPVWPLAEIGLDTAP